MRPTRASPAHRAATAAAAALLAGLIAALVGVPLWSLGRIAADAGAAGIWRVLSAPGSRVAVVHTVTVAAAVTVLAVTGGTALALAVERRPGRSRRTARLLVAGPLVIPEFVLGFAWSQAYGPQGLSDRLAGLTLPHLFGLVGIVAVLTVYGLPLAYLAVTAGLAARADPALERAARSAGASATTTLRTVTLPLLRIPLLGAAALVFVTAAGSFAVPQVLGTPAGFATMPTLVYSASSCLPASLSPPRSPSSPCWPWPWWYWCCSRSARSTPGWRPRAGSGPARGPARHRPRPDAGPPATARSRSSSGCMRCSRPGYRC